MWRRLESDDAHQQMRWLCGDSWPPKTGIAGFNPVDRWPASVWILHAIYENDALPDNLTHHDVHQQLLDAGLEEPLVINGYNLGDGAVRTGGGLGFAERLGPPWRRVSWADLGRRDGFTFRALHVENRRLTVIPQPDWADPAVLPTATLPEICPATGLSWPVSIEPPTEGSLDEQSLLALIDILTQRTSFDVLEQCLFYYGFAVRVSQGDRVCCGALGDLASAVTSEQWGDGYTPSNFWPADKSWFVYTDYDLCATRVSGSGDLIDALSEADALETVRCG